MRAKFVNEAIKHLKPRTPEELEKFKIVWQRNPKYDNNFTATYNGAEFVCDCVEKTVAVILNDGKLGYIADLYGELTGSDNYDIQQAANRYIKRKFFREIG